MNNTFQEIVNDGIDLAHKIPVYGDLVESFYTAIGKAVGWHVPQSKDPEKIMVLEV